MPELEIIEKTFWRVRSVFVWTADKEVFGTEEYWESLVHPIKAGAEVVKGDCDDFAITCLDLLIEEQLPKDRLRLLLCYTEANEYHCVAGVDHEQGTWILDNRQRKVRDFAALRYKWDRSMRLSKPGKWVYVT